VGKTTTCKELTKHFDVFTIPEVIRKPVPKALGTSPREVKNPHEELQKKVLGIS
jgi:hypothetical protein